jgi:hypothetical protein
MLHSLSRTLYEEVQFDSEKIAVSIGGLTPASPCRYACESISCW